MNQSRPAFSILLPTYNRGYILPLAIRSVLGQTFSDFELIISNGGSTDNTDEVVRGFTDTRIRYFNSYKKLSMAENYELTLNSAEGEYIIFFSDDDAFVPTLLQKVRDVIENTGAKMVVFPFARYYHEDRVETGSRRNTLGFMHFTGNVYSVQSRDDIRRMAAVYGLAKRSYSAKYTSPLIGNVVFHRGILDELSSKVNHLFSTIPVDIYVITLILSCIDSYVVIDEPLLVWSQWAQNSSVGIKKDLREHYEKLLGGKTLEYVPLKFPLPINCGANALLTAANDIGMDWSVFGVDWKHYYVEMQNYLIYLEGEGVDISKEMAELKQVAKKQGADIQDAVENSKSATRFLLKRIIKQTPFGKALRRVKRRISKPLDDIELYGDRSKFADVNESAIYLSMNLEALKRDSST